MIRSNLSVQEAMEHLEFLQTCTYRNESEWYAEMGLCHAVLGNYEEARSAFEISFSMEPTELVGRKLAFAYLKNEDVEKLECLVLAMREHGLHAGNHNETVLKCFLAHGKYQLVLDLAQSRWCDPSAYARLLMNAGMDAELLSLLEDAIDVTAEVIPEHGNSPIVCWVTVLLRNQNYGKVKELFDKASYVYKRQIAVSSCNAEDPEAIKLSLAMLEWLFVESRYTDNYVATRLGRQYRKCGLTSEAKEMAHKILDREIPAAIRALPHCRNLALACEVLGDEEFSREIFDTVNKLTKLVTKVGKIS